MENMTDEWTQNSPPDMLKLAHIVDLYVNAHSDFITRERSRLTSMEKFNNVSYTWNASALADLEVRSVLHNSTLTSTHRVPNLQFE